MINAELQRALFGMLTNLLELSDFVSGQCV